MILLVQKSENCCHLDVHPKSQPQNVLKMFLVFQEIEPIVLINVFLHKKRSVMKSLPDLKMGAYADKQLQ